MYLCVCVHSPMWGAICTCVCVFGCVYLSVFMYLCMRGYMYLFVWVCVCVCLGTHAPLWGGHACVCVCVSEYMHAPVCEGLHVLSCVEVGEGIRYLLLLLFTYSLGQGLSLTYHYLAQSWGYRCVWDTVGSGGARILDLVPIPKSTYS